MLISIFLLAFTLSRSHRHRFPRFFVFEGIFALVIINARIWFRNPLSLQQIFSWIFLTCSLFLALHGFWLLHRRGSPKENFEDTQQLVTVGVYKYIRHPLYSSLVFGGVGVFLKDPSVVGVILFIFVFIFVFVTAKVEEKDNINKFGDDYLIYKKKSKMFLPFLI